MTILNAAAAAPKPASMFTTLTPGAQLFIMVSMAATPPKEAPYPTLPEEGGRGGRGGNARVGKATKETHTHRTNYKHTHARVP